MIGILLESMLSTYNDMPREISMNLTARSPQRSKVHDRRQWQLVISAHYEVKAVSCVSYDQAELEKCPIFVDMYHLSPALLPRAAWACTLLIKGINDSLEMQKITALLMTFGIYLGVKASRKSLSQAISIAPQLVGWTRISNKERYSTSTQKMVPASFQRALGIHNCSYLIFLLLYLLCTYLTTLWQNRYICLKHAHHE